MSKKKQIPDADRIKQFCLCTARTLCDDMSDTEINFENNKNIYAVYKEALEFIDKCVEIANKVDVMCEGSEEESRKPCGYLG